MPTRCTWDVRDYVAATAITMEEVTVTLNVFAPIVIHSRRTCNALAEAICLGCTMRKYDARSIEYEITKQLNMNVPDSWCCHQSIKGLHDGLAVYLLNLKHTWRCSNAGVDEICFALRATRLMECLTAVPDAKRRHLVRWEGLNDDVLSMTRLAFFAATRRYLFSGQSSTLLNIFSLD